jgi:MFS family permease
LNWPENVKPQADRDRVVINLAGFLRSFGVGLMGVVLGIYLSRLGFSALTIGIVVAVGLAGASSATAMVSFFADRFGRKRSVLLLSLLTAIGGLALAFSPALPLFLVMIFIAMLNGTGTERSPIYALEQAVIPGLVPDSRRTWSLAFYNVLIDGGGSLGALCAGLPFILHNRLGLPLLTAYKFLFLGYAGLYLATAALYLFLSPAIEIATSPGAPLAAARIAPQTRKVVAHLTALFSLDAFGGGFLTDALVSYWFFHRFGIAERELGVVFFVVHILNALSHMGAAWLARRIGLLNTMVFTHLPSSLFLMAVPFASSFKWAAILFFCREALVEMDVPTRQSYVAALVKPSERTLTSGITNLARNVFWAIGSATAGVAMQVLGFSTPLLIGGGAKIIYDALLYKSFRKLNPPEETARTAG